MSAELTANSALVPLERKVKLLKNFMSSCAGQAVDENGLIRILNATGSKPPLIWSFNALSEFPALAIGLGSDQPVIGIRSLNAVVDYTRKLIQEDTEIAAYYAKLLQEHFDLTTFWIGGNCQGAAVAAELASHLSLQGKHALGLFQMEWQNSTPWPGPCHFLFGAESVEYNPFLAGKDPWPLWRKTYQEVSCDFLPGTHGQYFTPENLPDLTSKLQRYMYQKPSVHQIPKDLGQGTDLHWLPPTEIETNAPIHLEAQTDVPSSSELEVLSLWVPHTPGQIIKTETCSIAQHDDVLQILLHAPSNVGQWSLQIFRCNDQNGPLFWKKDVGQSWTIQIC
jgi:hypothetical protein